MLTRNTNPVIAEPTDPYDTVAWAAFYDKNPGFRRSVGAAGVNDDDDDPKPGEGDDPKPGEEPKPGESDDPKPGDDGKPSDKEAQLLKDAMKHKTARRDAEKQLSELQDKFKDIDLDEYLQMKADQAKAADEKKAAEEQKLLDKGEFDKVKAQMVEQHGTELQAMKDAGASKDAEIAKLNGVIEELTVGTAFSSSKFISEDTVFTSTKARRLYADHFEVEDGKVVGYDKPRGAEDRTVLVNASGEPTNFEEAMKRIIEADPEKDEILRAKMKPGGASAPGGKGEPKTETKSESSRDKISNGLKDLVADMAKPTDPGIKLT